MYEYEIVKVEKVVDGDTIDVLFDVGFSMFRKERVRLNGIDTPESTTKDAREKSMGREAKTFAAEWLRQQKTLKAKTTKDDKYGRILADIYGDDGVCLNEVMVAKGYAWKYDGGTKVKDFDVLMEKRNAPT
jgi:endonuclease YncB( thermonuclease family)